MMLGGVLKLTVSCFRKSKSVNLTLLDACEKLLGDGYYSISISASESQHPFCVLEPIWFELSWRAGTFNFWVGGDTYFSLELDSGLSLLFTGEMSRLGIGVSKTFSYTSFSFYLLFGTMFSFLLVTLTTDFGFSVLSSTSFFSVRMPFACAFSLRF